MKKTFVAIMLGITVFAVAGCNSDKPETEIGEPLVIERPAVTTTTSTPVVEDGSVCKDSVDGILEGLTTITDAMDTIAYISDEEVLEFLATAKEFVTDSVETVELCAYLAPEEALDFKDSLYAVLDSLDKLEDVYNTH